MEFIIYVVYGTVCAVIGYHIKGIIFRATISENPDKIIKILEEIKKINDTKSTDTDVKVEVEPEKVNNVWYAYAKDSGQFLGQGCTLEDAIRNASLRFPNKTFWCETLKSNLTKQT